MYDPEQPRRAWVKPVAWLVGIAAVVAGVWYWMYSNDHGKRGAEAFDARDFDSAIDHYTQLIQKEPAKPEGYYFRGGCYRIRHEFDLAESDARWLIDHNYVNGYSSRGRLRLAQRRYAEALADFERAAAEGSSSNPTWHLDKADYYLEMRQFDRAEAEARAALALDPKEAAAYGQLSSAASGRYDCKSALDHDSKAVELDPAFHGNYLARAFDWIELRDEPKALADIEKAIQLCPRTADAWRLRSDIHVSKKEYDRALECADRAVAAAPWEPAEYASRAAVFFWRKEYQRSADEYGEAVRRDPNDRLALANRVYPLLRLREYDRAVASAEEADRVAPHAPSGTGALAWILATCPDAKYRDGKRAVELAQKATEMTFEKDAYYLRIRAAAHAEDGDFAAAEAWQQKSLDAPGSFVQEERENDLARLKLYKAGKPYRDE